MLTLPDARSFRFAAIVLALSVAGCSDKKDSDAKSSGSTSTAHATPEAAFAAAKTALGKEDWKGFCQVLTPESRDAFAGGMAFAGMMMQGFASAGGADGEKDAKNIQAVLDKHGLTEEVMKKNMEGDQPASQDEAMKKLLEPVKDRDAFVADIMAALDNLKGNKKQTPMDKDATLKDLKVEEDSATATIEFEKEGKKVSEPVSFKKIDGGWRLHMDMDKKGKGQPINIE